MDTRQSHICTTSCEPSGETSDFIWTVPPANTSKQVAREPIGSKCPANGCLTRALAAVIRTRRLALGISQQSLAQLIGMDRGYLISIEQAKRNPSVTTFFQIATGLSLSASDLLRLVEQAAGEQN